MSRCPGCAKGGENGCPVRCELPRQGSVWHVLVKLPDALRGSFTSKTELHVQCQESTGHVALNVSHAGRAYFGLSFTLRNTQTIVGDCHFNTSVQSKGATSLSMQDSKFSRQSWMKSGR